jgi:predicted secreted acid phosphatase
MNFCRISLVLIFSCIPAFSQAAIETVKGEPSNLDDIKQQLVQYESPLCQGTDCYTPQIERQIDLAITFLKQSVASRKETEKLALVLDIDETALSNWAVETHDNFGYIANDSNWCISLRCSTAIPGTLRLFHEAQNDKVTVFFITGRPEGQRKDTEANLKAVGYDRWEKVYLRPEDHPKAQTVPEYKSGERAKIVAMGYRIVLNVGDQMSDLVGDPQAEHSVKLPNPFYCIPVVLNGTCSQTGTILSQ